MRNLQFRVLLAVLVVCFGGFCLFMYSGANSPTLQAVLSGEKINLDYGFVIFGLFAFSLATLSLAKSYDIMQTSNTTTVIEKRPVAEDKNRFAMVKGENERIIALNKNLIEQVEDLKKDRNALIMQVKKFEEAFRDKVNNEDLLKKSVTSLKKDNEELKQQLVASIAEKSSLAEKQVEEIVVATCKVKASKGKTSANPKKASCKKKK